jgi:OmpA-OmpF porin, OOP family
MLKANCGVALAGLLALLLGACASAPKPDREEIFNRYPHIENLRAGLADAAGRDADLLAPDGYRAAGARLEAAIDDAIAGRAATTATQAAEGERLLAKVNRDADTARVLLEEVLEARERARDAGAASLFGESLEDVDSDLRKTAGLVERGRLEEVKQRRPRLLAAYEQLELAALKEGMVDAARAAIAAARDQGAAKLAPRTFRLAEEEMALALSVLDADRTRTGKANEHARRALWLAERSSAITELIKDFERRKYTREDLVLWYQDQLDTIHRPLGGELPFNLSNRELVLGMQQAVDDLVRQRDATAATSSRYEQALSMNLARRKAVADIQAMFDAAEADVYEQRGNVLISAHGFRFPPGGSELEAQNFGLLNKIVRAISLFPDSRINVSGHTDATGSPAINQTLSELRAANVARFLSEVGGIDAQRISVQGYGKDRPVASNDTAQGRAANRRVEVLIINE